jgi:hypothetical protein
MLHRPGDDKAFPASDPSAGGSFRSMAAAALAGWHWLGDVADRLGDALAEVSIRGTLCMGCCAA